MCLLIHLLQHLFHRSNHSTYALTKLYQHSIDLIIKPESQQNHRFTKRSNSITSFKAEKHCIIHRSISQIHITFIFGSQKTRKQENKKRHNDSAQPPSCHITLYDKIQILQNSSPTHIHKSNSEDFSRTKEFSRVKNHGTLNTFNSTSTYRLAPLQ